MQKRLFKEILKKLYFGGRGTFLKSTGILIDKKERDAKCKPEKIFIYGLRRLGDMVMSLPAFEATRREFKDAFIVLAATEYNKGLVDGKYFDEIIIQPSTSSERKKFISKLKSYRFDVCIDLTCDYDIFPAYAIYKSGAGIRIGYDIAGRGVFYTRAKPFLAGGKHAVTLITELIGEIIPASGFQISNSRYEPLQDDIEYAKKYLLEQGLTKPIIGIHPGAHFPSQRWHIEKFANAISEIKGRNMGDVIIFGGSGDKGVIEEITGALKTDTPLVILDQPIKRLAAFIKLCDIFICNNSGPLHLAAAMGISTVSTMGPTDYDLWHPLGDRNIVITEELPCSPCNKAECREHDCMNLITVEKVMDAVVRQLRQING